MPYRQITYDEFGEIRVIRFNRPEVMNCIGPVTHAELVEAWNRFRPDEAAIRGFGLPLDEGLRIEVQCFNRSIKQPETAEGLRRFVERDHPDRLKGRPSQTPGLVRD